MTSRILGVAEITDRKPQANVHPGHISRVLRFFRDEMLRIAVSGYDPLIPPAEGKPLPRVKEIKVTASADSDDEYELHTRLEPSPDSTADHLAAQDACPKIQ